MSSSANVNRSASAAIARHDTLGMYLKTLRQAVPDKLKLALVLMLGTSLTEWVGLLLLIPLLGLAGVEVGQGAAGRLAESVSALIGRTGLRPTLLTVLIIYVGIISARALLQRWQTLVMVDLTSSFVHYLRERLYRAIVNARWLFFVRNRSSDFLHALTGQIATAGHATETLLSLAAGVLIGSIYLLLAFKVSPTMTVLACACGTLLVFLLRRGVKRAREIGGQMSDRNGQFLAAVTEHLGGMKTAKSYGAEDRSIEVFSELDDRVMRTRLESHRNHTGIKIWFEIGSVIALSALLYISVEALSLATAEILLLLFLFARLVPRFSALQQMYQHFVNALPAFSIVMEMLERSEAAEEVRLPGTGRPREIQKGVRLAGVSFNYRENGAAPTLQRVDLAIPACQTTAIVGSSGAGKSTLADIVMGLIVPTGGRVLVDEAPLSPERLRDWREAIGYVPQDTFLFHDTIRGNLLWAHPKASEADLWEALQLAAADDFVRRLPSGLDTVVGDRGVLLSGGERQRIALARALLRSPGLLILDEATSALDSENERRIQEAIERLHGRLTILIITHRLSTIRRADTIYVIEDGRVVETGDWDSLLESGGRFAALAAAQGIGRLDRKSAPPVGVRMLTGSAR